MLDKSNMSENLKDFVLARLEALGLNKFEAATRVGLARTYFNDIIRGKSNSVRDDLKARVAEALGVSVSELVNFSPSKAKVPVVGLVAAGSDAVAFADGQGPFGLVAAPEDSGPETVAVEVRGSSLGDLLDGSTLFYDDVHKPVSPSLIGRLCVLGLADGRVVVKSLHKGQIPNRWNLLANVGPPIYDAEVLWAAKVKLIRPKG